MNKLIVVAGLASTMMCGAATFEEQYALSRIPNDQVTAANAQAVIEASVATTNYGKIAYCRNAGFITAAQVQEMLAGKLEFANSLVNNASVSSDATVQAACIDSLVALAKSSDKPFSALYYAVHDFDNRPERRMTVANELIAVGKKVAAIQVIFGSVPVSVYRTGSSTDSKWVAYGPEYLQFCRDNADSLLAAWLEAEPTTYSNGRLYDAYTDGIDIVAYLNAMRDERLNSSAVVKKCAKYANDGQGLWMIYGSQQIHVACGEAYLASGDKGIENVKVNVAKNLDRVNKNKDVSNKILWPQLKDDANKVNVALYLNDVDKLIDVLKTVGDKLDAKVVESVIAPLNGVNAGYRTADLRLALMNVNKKYTLKLYDDRDTWEPILSKIRAMIDAL